MQELKEYLSSQLPGPIEDIDTIATLLEDVWDNLIGSDAEGMAAYKLDGRIEEPTWEPPVLSFIIERHGGTVQGSSRAELQRWSVDIDTRMASVSPSGHRQLKVQAKRVDIKPIAEEISSIIVSGTQDERIKWNDENTAKVQINLILPEGSAKKQTLAGRRKRFREELTKQLAEHGWKNIRPNLYCRL